MLVRPHPEYGNTIWYPELQKYSVQTGQIERATKMAQQLKEMTYDEERLKVLALPSLDYRKMGVRSLKFTSIQTNNTLL